MSKDKIFITPTENGYIVNHKNKNYSFQDFDDLVGFLRGNLPYRWDHRLDNAIGRQSYENITVAGREPDPVSRHP